MNKPTKFVVCGLCVLAVVVALVYGTLCFVLGNEASPSVSLANVNCNSFSNASSVSYSASLIASQNFNATQGNLINLVKKYGEITAENSDSASDPTGPQMEISGNLAFGNIDAFLNDLQAIASTSHDTLEGVSYDTTTGAQTIQSCLDAQNTIRVDVAEGQLLLKQIPVVLKNDSVSSSTGESTLEDLSTQIQDQYSEVVSQEDSIASLQEGANIATVDITVQNQATPTYGKTPVSNSN